MNYEPEIDTIIELLSWEYVLPDPIEEAMRNDLSRILNDCLDTLTPREAKVLRMRFGIDRDRDYTFDQIGQMFGVTKERVRQIEAKALRKMRHPARSQRILQAHSDCQPVKSEKELEELGINKLPDRKVEPEQKQRPPLKWVQEWVRRWDRKDPDEMVMARASPNGWIDGSKYQPMIPGVYVRRHNNFEAFSKWDGKNWLQGAKEFKVANKIPNDKISSYQLIQWRKVKHNEQL
jgi:DNA-binding CsgD family transcriptional regulator